MEPGDRPLRVAHLTTIDLSLRYLLLPQLQAVLDAGGEALGVSAPGPWVDELTVAGIRHVPLTASTRGMNSLADLRAAGQLWRALRRERPEVLHTHNPKPGVYGRILGRAAGVPVVVNTLHGLYATEDDRWTKRMLVYGLEALAARFSDVELVQNPEDLAFCLRWRIIPRGKGRLLGNGVQLSRFDPERVDAGTRSRVREELGIGGDQVAVGMVGRLVAEKGYPEFFEAASSLDQRFVVLAVGPDDPEKEDALPPELLAGAREAGVRFLGMRTDIERVYAALDVFVLPSHREGFPRAAMEAAAMALPIVATDIRGCREVVEDGVNGLLVPVRDPGALANAIRALGEDPELRVRMGEAGRRRAQERFDERVVVRIVMETYREALVRKGMAHLLPLGMREDPDAVVIRAGVPADAGILARLHSDYIGSGFLPRLGTGFMRILYRALIRWDQSVVLLAADGTGPVAFTVGVLDVGGFYRYFLRRYAWRAGLAALPRLLRPGILWRAWETLRYGQGPVAVPAELLSMVVAPVARGRGLSVRLGEELLEELRRRGAKEVKVVVGSENDAALGAYRKMGFVDAGRFEVHSGEGSEVLVWRD